MAKGIRDPRSERLSGKVIDAECCGPQGDECRAGSFRAGHWRDGVMGDLVEHLFAQASQPVGG